MHVQDTCRYIYIYIYIEREREWEWERERDYRFHTSENGMIVALIPLLYIEQTLSCPKQGPCLIVFRQKQIPGSSKLVIISVITNEQWNPCNYSVLLINACFLISPTCTRWIKTNGPFQARNHGDKRNSENLTKLYRRVKCGILKTL